MRSLSDQGLIPSSDQLINVIILYKTHGEIMGEKWVLLLVTASCETIKIIHNLESSSAVETVTIIG